MLRQAVPALALLAFGYAANLHAADLTMRFVYDGKPPKPKPIEIRADKNYFADKQIVDESLLVHPENRGIANVAVYLYTGRRAVKPPPTPHQPRTVELTTKDGRLLPRIAAARVGDTIQVNNEDEVGHNFNFSFFNNPPVGYTIAPNEPQRRLIKETEPAPVPVSCNIHPWPRAYLICVDHPYVGVSDENGVVTIKDLPKGLDLTFRVFHESFAKFENVNLNGQMVKWPRRLFTQTFSADDFDMGTVTLKPDQFKSE